MNKLTTYQPVPVELRIPGNETITVAMWSLPDKDTFLTTDLSLFCGSKSQCVFVGINKTEEADFVVMDSRNQLGYFMNSYKEDFPTRPAGHKLVLMNRESPIHTGLSSSEWVF